ncbi:hypothetical protein [Mucilaginibacter sp. OK098]|uniref:hypothetical protein n=1 Tax=Mucilaginibacter sp. OK098 TaxID=1855297 RepID=UPI00092112E0|nr:hypothetical protein [Mucilaginibacter sp. OK098]SHM92233.1 hypothetical protein SAMN05216524_104124 [Mucilaginibacter sp. OK098]
MKKLLIIAILISGLASCKKDNNSTQNDKVSIVGKWRYKSQRVVVYNVDGSVHSDETLTQFGDDKYLQYNEDGTGKAYDGGSDFEFTYSIKGNTETEYKTPTLPYYTPYIYTVSFTKTTLTRHIEVLPGNGTRSTYDEVLYR